MLVSTNGLMVMYILVIGEIIKELVRVHIYIQMEQKKLVYGKIINLSLNQKIITEAII